MAPRGRSRGYLARELLQCTLPHRDTNEEVYVRRDGDLTFMIEAGKDPETRQTYGLPYGIIPRLLLIWLSSEVVRTRESTITLGSSLSDFLREVGLSPETGRGKRGDAKRLKDQIERLFNARLSFSRTTGTEEAGSRSRMNMNVSNAYTLWWDFRNPDQNSFFHSQVRLSAEFYEALVSTPVPLPMDAIRQVKSSPMAIDALCWLCWRSFRLKPGQKANISYRDLKAQFGSGYDRMDNFKAAFKKAVAAVKEALPELDVEFASRALIVRGVERENLPVLPEAISQQESPFQARRAASDPFAISLRDLDRIKARYPGWDLEAMRRDWKAWCQKRGFTPQKPAAHFSKFMNTHEKRNGRP